MNFDKAVEISLRTWYPKDHELHMNPHHPLGKLLGEWGELLDDYMKSLYKPGYVFEPEDELGDIWYYVRILCYQGSVELSFRDDIIFISDSVDCLIVETIACLSDWFLDFYFESDESNVLDTIWNTQAQTNALNQIVLALVKIAKRYNLTLDDLTRSNWQKLKPGSERGEEWMRARVVTDYVGGGKIGLK